MSISPLSSNMLGFNSSSFYNVGKTTSLENIAKAQKALKDTSLSKLDRVSSALSTLHGYEARKPDYTAESAAAAAADGTPTHAFLYHDIDALAKSAVASTDDTAAVDSTFAKDTLDFFTGGNYTQADVESLQKQMTTALKELGTQVQENGSVDVSKLKSTVNVGGVEMSLKDLADFQTMGQKIAPVFNSISETSSRFDDMQSTAKMAVAKLMSQRFGQTRGEAGQLFANAMEGLYNKGMDRINDLYADSTAVPDSYKEESSDIRSQVSDLFSQVRTDNNSLMAYDFNRSLNNYKGMVNQQYRNFGTPIGYRNANMAAQQMGMYFTAMSRLLG